MATTLRSRYQQESILYTYIRHHVLDRDRVQMFREESLKLLKSSQTSQYDSSLIQDYKNNPAIFLQDTWVWFLDMQEFVQLVAHIENYYSDHIADFTHLRWYQYITLLITFIFCKLHTSEEFTSDYLGYIYNEVLAWWSDWDYNDHVSNSFNRLGYWMATASGKTILMYAIVYMYAKLIAPDTKVLYVLVPNDELRTQHYNFMTQTFTSFGAERKDQIISISHLNLFGDANLDCKLTTLSKMVGEWVAEWLDSNSLMVFDEAHKWAGWAKEDSATEIMKNHYIKKSNTFLFEFSATFQAAFEADGKRIKDLGKTDKNIFDRYMFSNVFKYNLYDFNADGFGKNYYVNNLSGADDKTIEWKRKLVCDSLVHLGLQLLSYETIKSEYKNQIQEVWSSIKFADGTKLYQPLYMGLSWSLIGTDGKVDEKWGTSLVDILTHISYIFSHYDEYSGYILKKIEELYHDELKIREQVSDKKLYQLLTGIEYKEWSQVSLQIRYDKQSDEIKLLLGKKKMLINTGSNSKVEKVLRELIPDMFWLQELFGAGGRRFQSIDTDPDILYVFGSKKFIEWWDSKRPSTIMLFKMGKWSTIVATQILGRWLRLAGKEWDGFRHISKRIKANSRGINHHTHLIEYVWLFGYEIDEFKKFIDQISGDILFIRIHKKRTFTKSFEEFLLSHGIDQSDEYELNTFLSATFPYLSQEIENSPEVIEDTTIEWVIEDGSFVLNLKRDGNIKEQTKKLWVVSMNGNRLVLKRDKFGSMNVSGNSYSWEDDYMWLRLLWEFWVKEFTKELQKKYDHRWLTADIRDQVESIIAWLVLTTDQINKVQSDIVWYEDTNALWHHFDISLQKNIVQIFCNYVRWLFAHIDNRSTSVKTKTIKDHDLALTVANLIDWLTINIWIKKTEKEYDVIKKAFKLEDSTYKFEEEYDNLKPEHKKIFDGFLSAPDKDLHFYERLYFLPLLSQKDWSNYLHDLKEYITIDNSNIDVHDFSPEPTDMKLNHNEETRIEQLLKQISLQKTQDEYDIFYLRNLVWAWWIKFAYTDVSGEYKYFYPDFVFWFIDKNSNQKTIIYFEPKSAVDPNWILKEFTLNELVGKQVDESIKTLFDSVSRGETFWWGKVI